MAVIGELVFDPTTLLAAGAGNMPLLLDIFVLFALALVTTYVCDRLRIPTLIGLLITGIIAGPNGLEFVRETENVDVLAEVGVILLLFSIGIEFSLKSIMQMKNAVMIGGFFQFLLTGLVTAGICQAFGLSLQVVVFIGFLMILSSTAIVLKLLQARGEIDAPQGRLAVGILIFQDLIVVPMMLVTPLLAGQGSGGNPALELGLLTVKAIAVVAAVIIASHYLIPWLFFQIAGMRDREVFLLSVVVVVLAIAWLTQQIGLSLALGAFLAGLVISESDYNHRALASLLPFKEIFMSLFFISIGMLFDSQVLLNNPLLILGLTAAIILLKGFCAILTVLIMRYPTRIALLVGLSLAQVGEFSFILAKVGEGTLLNAEQYQLFLAVSIATMIVAPFLIQAGPGLTDRLPARFRESKPADVKDIELIDCGLSDHLIIVGFGPTGRYTAQAAKAAKITYMIIELNPKTVRAERKKGEPIYYGDASEETVLTGARIESARVMLVVIADGPGSRRVTQVARSLNPTIHIIVRMRFIAEMEPLRALGADVVVPEELETAVTLLESVMQKYMIPADRIMEFISSMRAENYKALRDQELPEDHALQDLLAGIDINRLPVADYPCLIGQTLKELDFRNQYSLTILAIQRDGATIANPVAEERLGDEDILVVMGTPEALCRTSKTLKVGSI